MDIADIVEQLDGIDLMGIAATLAGLSIASASFLSGAAKDREGQLRQAKRLIRDTDDLGENASLPPDLANGMRNFLKRLSAEQKQLVNSASLAAGMLIKSFWYFVACLFWGFTFDPVIDQKFLSDAACGVANCYTKIGAVDVAATYTFFSIGLVYLMMGANGIREAVNDTTPTADSE